MWQLGRGLLGLYGLCLCVLVAVITPARQAEPRSAARAYATNYGDGILLYREWRDGTGRRALTAQAGQREAYHGVVWSPRGDWVAYLDYSLHLASADGRETRRPSNSFDGQAAWSPDGNSLVFQAFRGDNWDIYRLDLADGRQTRLTTHPSDDATPFFSPDGTRIVFASYRDDNWELYTMRPDGSEQTRLTMTENWELSPVWTGDGTWIEFEVWRDRHGRVRPDGSELAFLPDRYPRERPRSALPPLSLPWRWGLVLAVGGGCFAIGFAGKAFSRPEK